MSCCMGSGLRSASFGLRCQRSGPERFASWLWTIAAQDERHRRCGNGSRVRDTASCTPCGRQHVIQNTSPCCTRWRLRDETCPQDYGARRHVGSLRRAVRRLFSQSKPPRSPPANSLLACRVQEENTEHQPAFIQLERTLRLTSSCHSYLRLHACSRWQLTYRRV